MKIKTQNEILIKFIESFIGDFEADYVMSDGRIVDNPSDLLLTNYKEAKKVIETIQPK